MKLRYGDIRKSKNVNKTANKRPKAPVKAVVLLSGALAAGAAACGNKAEEMPKIEKQVIYETDSEGLDNLSERDTLLAYVMKEIMRDADAKLPVIDVSQGEMNLELVDVKKSESGADLTFVAYVTKKRDEKPEKEGELSGEEKLNEMGCQTWDAQLATSDAETIPVANCYDLNSVKTTCEAACEEKNPSKEKKKQESEDGEEEQKTKEKESKSEEMKQCISSCFGGALTTFMKNESWLEAVDMYEGLLGNGHCDDDQWARIRVIVYETDDAGNILKYDLKGNLVTYDGDGNVVKYDNEGNQVIKTDTDGNVVAYTEKDMEKAKPNVVDIQLATVLVGTEQYNDQECPKGKGEKSEPLTKITLVGGPQGQ